jgi:hypothetical protein
VNHLPGDGIILNLDVAIGKAAPRVPHVSRLSRHGIPRSGVIRIVLAISINSSNSSDTGLPPLKRRTTAKSKVLKTTLLPDTKNALHPEPKQRIIASDRFVLVNVGSMPLIRRESGVGLS